MKMNKVKDFIKKNPYFTIHDIKRIVGNEGYAYLVLNVLEKKGEVFRIARGFYSKYDDPSLIVYYFKPAYIGLQDAMSYLNLWEQETVTIVITTRNVRRGIRRVFGNNVIVKRIKPKYFFGFEFFKINGFYLPISLPEKTLIDLVYFKEWRKDYIQYFKGKVDSRTLKEFLNAYPERFRKRFNKAIENLL